MPPLMRFAWVALAPLVFSPSPALAQNEQWQGPARAALKAFVTRNKGSINYPWPVVWHASNSQTPTG
jgi:hypothetical protein